MFNVEEVKKVQNLKLQEQQRQQSLEVAKIKYRNKVKLNTAIAALSIFLVIAVVLWRNIKQKQKAYILLQDQKTKTDEALQELKTTQTQLIHQEKMASLGALTAGIAHEIQNPLNFVNNFSELNAELIDEMEREIIRGNIAEVKAIASNLKQNEQKIIHHGQRAEVIVKGMLQHSRTTTGHKEPTDINALADEYLRLSYHGLRAKDKDFTATIKTDFDKTLQKIDVVPEEIGRVLLNVFNNAYYAIKAKLQTSKKGETYEPTIILSTKKTNGKVVISVKDTGVGIPEKALNKIFQPFFTTKPTGQGTGLGLSISYDIIKAHHGELKVNSEEGKFAEFLIQLPAA
jgi:signal transduction histidine kinase